MTKIWYRRVRMLCAALACFCAGVIAYSELRIRYAPPNEFRLKTDTATAVPPTDVLLERTTGRTNVVAPQTIRTNIGELTASGITGTTGEISNSGRLRVPIDGVSIESLKGGFDEVRGDRPHEAVDILAPRNTPVHAVTTGAIAKLFYSKAGGNTIYQFDPEGRRCYYYAHLDRYVEGLRDGQAISQGEVIGYVGTTGNAPPGTPHLHFAVFELDGDRRWWKGRAVDPYLVFKEKG